ncbi:hypothetical protein [Haemophilus haemolyticus]|uniref:hypothetical protein n=1 Tax=Haemophilus haemolyticus TaxID=726 RepID=UPI000E5915AD|nr:hypothetical protein [Haemophilus haemolyticus]
MKPTFKTTALAILVSLGATACLSNSGNSSAKPTPVQPQNSSDAPAITVATPEGYNYEEASKTSNGTKWRTLDLSNPVSADNSSVSNERSGINMVGSDSLMNGKLDFNEISGNKLGSYEGKKTINNKEVTYDVVNLPYASYGMVTGEVEPDSMVRASELKHHVKYILYFGGAYLPRSEGADWGSFGRQMGNKSKFTYEGNVKAMVKDSQGEVIAYNKNDGVIKLTVDQSKFLSGDEKQLDFTGEMSSKLLGRTIQLKNNKSDDVMFYNDYKVTGDVVYNTDTDGRFKLGFYGKGGFTDVVGEATIYSNPRSPNGDLGSIDGKKISSYEAVFGGQIQP